MNLGTLDSFVGILKARLARLATIGWLICGEGLRFTNTVGIFCRFFGQFQWTVRVKKEWKGRLEQCFTCSIIIRIFWVVVSNMFHVHPYLGKIPILTNIFQMGWNHQLGIFVRLPKKWRTHKNTFVYAPFQAQRSINNSLLHYDKGMVINQLMRKLSNNLTRLFLWTKEWPITPFLQLTCWAEMQENVSLVHFQLPQFWRFWLSVLPSNPPGWALGYFCIMFAMLGSFICVGKLCAHKLWHPKIHLSSILGLKKTDPTKTPGHPNEASSATTVCAFNVWWSYRSRETFRRWNHRVLHQRLETACLDGCFRK